MKLYKIRNKETGEYANAGTSDYRWSKTGKTWNNIGHIKNHLHGFNLKSHPYQNAEIIEIEMDDVNCFTYDVNDLVDELESNNQIKEQKYLEANARYQREKELKILTELKKKYEG